MIWATSVLTAGFFFATLLAHELSHALVARSRGITTRAITLFALGGVAQIEGEPGSASAEFWIGAIGPISSAVMGLLSLGIAYGLGWNGVANPVTPATAMLVWLGYINLGLALFNMIPGYPLDGGRILHAVIWWITGKQDRSTKLAARVGQGVALCFITLGVIRFFNGEGFGGLWIAFIGWFLLQAAGRQLCQCVADQRVEGRAGERLDDAGLRHGGWALECGRLRERAPAKERQTMLYRAGGQPDFGADHAQRR